MLKWDDILILGDSFAGSRSDTTDWPVQVVTMLTGQNSNSRQPLGEGHSGSSWWQTRKALIKHLEQKLPKVLIITHTEMQRIPHTDPLPLNISSVFGNDSSLKQVDPNIVNAARGYFTHLFNKEFSIWTQIQWFRELDELTRHIPCVIHLHSFQHWHSDNGIYIFNYGTTFDTALWDLSDDKKVMDKSAVKKVSDFLFSTWSDINYTRNHFSIENNSRLATAIVEAIRDYKPGIRHLTL